MIGGLAGCALHFVVDPSSTMSLVGCSGSLFALLAVAAVLWPSLLGGVVLLAGANIVQVLTSTGGSVAVGAHLGGFCAGTVFAAFSRPWSAPAPVPS